MTAICSLHRLNCGESKREREREDGGRDDGTSVGLLSTLKKMGLLAR